MEICSKELEAGNADGCGPRMWTPVWGVWGWDRPALSRGCMACGARRCHVESKVEIVYLQMEVMG